MAKWIAVAEWADGTFSECTPRSRRDTEKWARTMRDVALVRSVSAPIAFDAEDGEQLGLNRHAPSVWDEVLSENASDARTQA